MRDQYAERIRNENLKLRGSSTIPWCSYGDDMVLFMLDIHSLQRATTILYDVFTSYGLCINVSKTETTILNHMLLEDEYSDSINSLYNVPLQNTTKFKDLDSFIFQNKPNTGDIETNHCIRMAYAKSATMANLLQNSTIHLKTKVKFRNTFVHSRLMYSCQNRNSTVVQFEKLEVTNWNLLKRMIRGGFKSIGDNDGDS